MRKTLADVWEDGFNRGIGETFGALKDMGFKLNSPPWMNANDMNPYTNNPIEAAERRVIDAANDYELKLANRFRLGGDSWDESKVFRRLWADAVTKQHESCAKLCDAVRALRELESEAK